MKVFQARETEKASFLFSLLFCASMSSIFSFQMAPCSYSQHLPTYSSYDSQAYIAFNFSFVKFCKVCNLFANRQTTSKQKNHSHEVYIVVCFNSNLIPKLFHQKIPNPYPLSILKL